MALVKGCKWAKVEFEKGSRPTNDTMVRWIDNREIPGKIIDGLPYVDADRFALSGPRPGTEDSSISGLDLIA